MSGPHDREPDELLELGEAPATPEERARAASLGRLVEDMLDGRPAPPALAAEERALLETATAVHASLGEAGLSPMRAKAVLDSVLGRPLRGDPTAPAPIARRPTTIPPPRAASVTGLPSLPGSRRRAMLRRALPWTVAALSAAAALLLWLRAPSPPAAPSAPRATATLRSADAVLGAPIARAQAADASARLDALLADRRALARADAAGRGGVR